MPKKFQGENTKATEARARKAEAKSTEKTKREQEKEDALWEDDNKLVQKKMQRKNEQEQKRQQQLDRRQENQKAYEEEMGRLAVNKAKQLQAPQKVTQAQIEHEKQLEEQRQKEQEKQRVLEKKSIVVADETEELPENMNRLNIEAETAGSVDTAIQLLKGVEGATKAEDKHPEKRMKAAYTAFEERRIPQLKEEHPTLRLSQLKQLVKKEWQKSPDNPLNQNIMAIIK